MLYRKAKMTDVHAIQELINNYADAGLMLPRSLNAIYETLFELTVAENEGKIIGVGALHVIWDNLAEVRCLAVAKDFLRQGVGRKLVEMFLAQAQEVEIKKVFALTYKPEFFQACGFDLVSKDNLPHKVWKECINCPKFPDCDEVAVLIEFP